MKIKFPDTGQILEVKEASQLANTKVRVTPETSRQIQEAAFPLGIKWGGLGDRVINLGDPFLYLDEDTIMCGGQEDYFKMRPSREFIFIPSLEHTDPTDKELSTDIRTVEAATKFIQDFDKVNGEAIMKGQLKIAIDALKDIRDWDGAIASSWYTKTNRAGMAINAIQDFDKANPQPEDKWISVKDRLPEEGTCVLCFGEGGRWFTALMVQSGLVDYEYELCEGVTHWQPVPPKPLNS